MTKSYHFRIVKDGPSYWNAWREEYQDIRPDLSGAKRVLAHL